MAQEDTGLRRQGEHLLDRLIQGARIATREIAAGGAVVGHEQGIAHKRSVVDHVGQASGGVARGMQHPALQVADDKGVAFLEQLIELAAIACKFGPGIKGLAKDFLNVDDFCANTGLATQLFVQIGCG